jgi:hypothetical protein
MATERSSRKAKTASPSVYELKITLLGSDPPIWRRVQVLPETTLGELNFVLQAVMGWTDSHLHQFTIREGQYSDPQFELDGAEDEFDVTLGEVAPRARRRFEFLYDFGDGWEHDVVVERIVPCEPRKRYPACVGGERACPPEDCGGVWGYLDFLEAIGNPDHEEHEGMLAWFGGAFDPEAFDVKAVNKQLVRDAKMMASWQ